jgi:glycosyltransferase involved in cell wall biosynthesis
MDHQTQGPDRPLRILHTESSWGWGGQELRILTESAALQKRGHMVSIATVPNTPLFQAALERGIPVFPVPIRKKRLEGLWAIRKLLSEQPQDVVNTHSSTDAWLTALACCTLRLPPRIVRTRHVSTPVKASAANQWLFNKSAAAVVTTGEVVRKMLIEDLHINPHVIASVPTGVDSQSFRAASNQERQALRAKLGLPQSGYLIGTVATLRLLKGMDYLFEAIKQLNDPSLHLCVVGDGPQRQHLDQLRQQLGLQARITMAGEQRNVQEWLRAFDLFAFPSLAEGVPQALAQAMLTQLPCVTTHAGGIPELAQHMKTAWVCPPRNAQALAEGILAIRGDPGLGTTLAANARQHCIDQFSVDAMAERMLAIYRLACQPVMTA